jgi:uncharacterized protein YihD (DUF1040 family)
VLIKDNADKKNPQTQHALFLSADEFKRAVETHNPGRSDVPCADYAIYCEAWENYSKNDAQLAKGLLADPQLLTYKARAPFALSVPVDHIVQLHTKELEYWEDDDEDGEFHKSDGAPEVQFYVELHHATNDTLVASLLMMDTELKDVIVGIKADRAWRKKHPGREPVTETEDQIAALGALSSDELQRTWSVSERVRAGKPFIVDDSCWAQVIALEITLGDNFCDLKNRVVFMPKDLPSNCYIALRLPK